MGRARARHENVTEPCTALLEWVRVTHHVAKALAEFTAAKSAPNAWHRDRAMGEVFSEIDAAEARLVALIETQPGLRPMCRKKMVEIDSFTGQVRAWAATIQIRQAEVIHLVPRGGSRPVRTQRQADRRPSVNENLLTATDDAPAAC